MALPHRIRISLHAAAIVLLLGLAALPRPAGAEWLTLTYQEAGFGALFPAQPEYTSETKTDMSTPYVIHTYIARADGLLFAVSYGEYPADFRFEPNAELKANQDNFNAGVNARLLTTRTTTYERVPGEILPALEFLSESDSLNLLFKGRIILDGQKAYMVVAGEPRGGANAAQTDQMIQSFHLLPR